MRKKENRLAFCFLAPGLAGFLLFYILPSLITVQYALSDKVIGGSFTGLANFHALFQSGAFRRGVLNTLKFMAVSIPLNLVIPLCIGLILHKVIQNRWLGTLFMSPLVIPSACIAFLFQSVFAGNGLVSRILATDVDWMQTEWSFLIAVLIYVWKNMGYNLVLILAGLSDIPSDYAEWAKIEGMSPLQYFFHIELFYLVPTLFIVLVMSFINSFKIFKEIYMLSGSYPHEDIYMLQHYMNNQFYNLNYQNLTAASIVITGLTAVVILVFFLLQNRADWGE